VSLSTSSGLPDLLYVALFLQSIFLDYPLDAPLADGKARLGHLLGNHLATGIRVKKTVPDNLLCYFRGPLVIGLGARGLVLKAQGPVAFKFVEHLIEIFPGVTVPGAQLLNGGIFPDGSLQNH
jgi:hypothetical protein